MVILPGRDVDYSHLLVPRLYVGVAIPLPPFFAFIPYYKVIFTFTFYFFREGLSCKKLIHTKILGYEILTLVFAHNAFIKPIIGKSCPVRPHFASLFHFKYEQSLLETKIQLSRFSQTGRTKSVASSRNTERVGVHSCV